MDNLELEKMAEAWVRAVKKAEEKIKREEEEEKRKREEEEEEKRKREEERARVIAIVSHRNRSPSFAGLIRLSDELSSFLGKTTGTEMGRMEATREINDYIRANSLQYNRKINADAKLSSLLKLKADEELTYFNLQRYLIQHFQKTQEEIDREEEESARRYFA